MGLPIQITAVPGSWVSIAAAGAKTLRRKQAWIVGAALLLFLVTRWYILNQELIFGSTMDEINVTYAIEASEAHRSGVPLSTLHRQNRLESSARRGRDISDSMDAGVIGYPPLCVAWMRVPFWFGNPIPRELQSDRGAMAKAVQRSRVSSAVLDLGAFLLLAGFLLYGYAGSSRQIGLRLAVYVVGGVLLSHLLYDRLDLVLGIILLAGTVLLASRHFAYAFFFLALGINFKLVPVVLAPLWIFAAMPPWALAPGTGWRKLAALVAARAGVLGAFCVLCLVPFLFSTEWGSLDYLSLHAARGIQMESIWASLALLGRHVGFPVELYSDSGSVNIRSSLTPGMTQLSTLCVAGSALMLAVCFWWYAKRRVDPKSPCRSIAQTVDSEVVAWSVLTLIAVMSFAKVFSASYPLWLVPLLPLMLPRAKKTGPFMGLFFVIFLLTTLLYPYIYSGELAPEVKSATMFRRFGDTSGFGETVLGVRNLLFLAAGGWLSWKLREKLQSNSESEI